MQKTILRLLCAISFTLLASCATPPPNVPVCAELTPDRGSCVYTVTGEQVEINETNKLEGKTWWEMRPAMLQMPASAWAKVKSWIIKVCKKNPKMCEDAVTSWDRTLDNVDSVQSHAP